MSPFAELLRKIADDTVETTPSVIMTKAREQVVGTGDVELIAACWAECGSDYARQVLSVANTGADSDDTTPPSAPKASLAQHRSNVTDPIFSGRLFCGPEHGWVLLGDATRKELRAAAEFKRMKAAEVMASAEAHDLLAEALPNNKAKVSSLDPMVVRSILTGGGS